MPTEETPACAGIHCADVRDALWPPERPRLVDGVVGRARAHLETCEACRDWFAQDRRLLAAYRRLTAERAPRGVKERVLARIAGRAAVRD